MDAKVTTAIATANEGELKEAFAALGIPFDPTEPTEELRLYLKDCGRSPAEIMMALGYE